MKKKLLVVSAVAVIMIATIGIIKLNSNNSSNTELKNLEYETYTYLSDDIKQSATYIEAEASLVNEYTPEYMLKISDNIVLASIMSVDYADAKLNTVTGSTYGKMVINNVLKGNIKEGEIVEYVKDGAILTLEEWESNLPYEAKQKHEEMRNKSGVDASKIYYNFRFENDPEVDEGKTYLCYLKYNDSIRKYEIIGLGNGFREINISKSKKVSSKRMATKQLKIKNNETGEYESLNEYIHDFIK